MKKEIEYESKIQGECAAGVDLSKLTNDNEISFVKRMKLYQDTVTHLQQNLEYCKYFYGLVQLNKTFAYEYCTFFTVFLNNISYTMINEISNMFADANALQITEFNKLYYKYSNEIFGKTIDKSISNEVSDNIKTSQEIYNKKIHPLRVKFFAHFDELALDENFIANGLKNIDLKDIEEIIENLKNALSLLWEQYTGKKMCFTLQNHNDYIKLVKVLCEEYGDTRFIDIQG